jgi:hypothetical protein
VGERAPKQLTILELVADARLEVPELAGGRHGTIARGERFCPSGCPMATSMG